MTVRGPFLLCIDHRAGTVRRYVRVFDQSGACLGWQTTLKGWATYDPLIGLAADVVEKFRITGNV